MHYPPPSSSSTPYNSYPSGNHTRGYSQSPVRSSLLQARYSSITPSQPVSYAPRSYYASSSPPLQYRSAFSPPPSASSPTSSASTRLPRKTLLSKLVKLAEIIRSILTEDQWAWFVCFVDHDQALAGMVPLESLRTMLLTYDSDITDSQAMELARLANGKPGVGFSDVLNWWTSLRSAGLYDGMWYNMKKAMGNVFAHGLSESYFESRLTERVESEVEDSIRAYRALLFDLRWWLHSARCGVEDKGEKTLLEQAKRVKWTAREKDDLRDLFLRVTKGKHLLSIESGLPRLCALLNCDLPFSALERLMKQQQLLQLQQSRRLTIPNGVATTSTTRSSLGVITSSPVRTSSPSNRGANNGGLKYGIDVRPKTYSSSNPVSKPVFSIGGTNTNNVRAQGVGGGGEASIPPAEMDFSAFLLWWACRPESGKLTSWRQPMWRWGSPSPAGTDDWQHLN